MAITWGAGPLALPDRALYRWLAAAASGALIAASFPPGGLPALAWVALVPLFVAVEGASVLRALGLGWIAGFIAAQGTFIWVFDLAAFRWYHAALLGAYLAAYPALGALVSRLVSREGRVQEYLVVPAVFVLLDAARGHLGFLELPWGTFGQTQLDNLALLQVASITGEHGITALLVAGNLAAFHAIASRTRRINRQRKLRVALAVLLIVAGAHAWGLWRNHAATGEGPHVRVAAVQPATRRPTGDDVYDPDRVFATLARLTVKAASEGARIIVWPESSLVDTFLGQAPALDDKNPWIQQVRALAAQTGTTIILGLSATEKFAQAEYGARLSDNQAVLVPADPAQPLAIYAKRLLVPFAEYLPAQGYISWPQWLVPRLFATAPAAANRQFTAEGLTVQPLICWENLFTRLLADAPPARVAVHLVNDEWFGDSLQPHRHALLSRLRAVEHGAGMVVASNTGPSAVFDPFGRTSAVAQGPFRQEVVVADLPRDGQQTLFNRVGEAGVLLVAAAVALWGMLSLRRITAAG